jgi:hypothetical protein
MDPFLNLANRLYEIVLSNINCLKNWGFYMLSAEFDDELELRNKIGTIWICSLLDTLEAERRFLPDVEKEAKHLNFGTLVEATHELAKFGMVTGEVLELFSREEQIYLQDFRNQLVHSYLASRHRSHITVKYFTQGVLHSEKLSDKDYQSLIRTFYEPANNPDELLYAMLSRILDRTKPHRYWAAVELLERKSQDLYKALLERTPFHLTFP